MRVIKPGRQHTGWSMEKECTGKGNGGGGCGALLLVEQADIFLTHRHVHVDHDVFHTFKCVCCGVLTDFEANEVPRGLNIPQSQEEWEKRKVTKLKPIEVDCPGCHGCGQVDIERGGTWIDCPECKGTGKREIL